MRKTRRILSIILTIALMMTMVQPNIFATDTSETSAVRGKINMVYLGTTPYSKPTDLQHADTLSPQKLPDTSTWTADATNGTVFWIGITLSGMKTMDTTASSDGLKSHFSTFANSGEYDWSTEGGLFNIAAGIEYASEYIKPAYASEVQMKNKAFYINTLSQLDKHYANNNYTVDAGTTFGQEIATSTGREPNEIDSADSPKLLYTSLTGAGTDSNIFGYTDDITDDPIYMKVI